MMMDQGCVMLSPRAGRTHLEFETSPPIAALAPIFTAPSRRKPTQRSANTPRRPVEYPWNLFAVRSCACPSADAYECIGIRYGIFDRTEEPCECACHEPDLDEIDATAEYRRQIARLNRTTDREIDAAVRRCPIENPRACLGARCQIFGICEHNRRLDGRPLSMAGGTRHV